MLRFLHTCLLCKFLCRFVFVEIHVGLVLVFEFKFNSAFFLKCLDKSIELLAKFGFRKINLRRMKQSGFLERASVVQHSIRYSDEIIVVTAFLDVSHNSLLKN